MIRGFAALSEPGPPARLIVVGDGLARTGLVALARILGIAAAVTFVPFVPHYQLPTYYQAADVTVVPSDRIETFCMVALEAIACRCPVIVTDQVPEIPAYVPGNSVSGRGVAAATPGSRVRLRCARSPCGHRCVNTG